MKALAEFKKNLQNGTDTLKLGIYYLKTWFSLSINRLIFNSQRS